MREREEDQVVTTLPGGIEGRSRPGLRLVDFLTASETALRPLKDIIARRDGDLNILIHPFFATGSDEVTPYTSRVDRLIQFGASGDIPLIVLEGNIPQFRRRVFLQQGLIFRVETLPKDPTPLVEPYDESNTKEQWDSANWDNFVDRLKNMGVKLVFVSGSFLGVYPQSNLDSNYFRNWFLDKYSGSRDWESLLLQNPQAARQWLHHRGVALAGCVFGTASELVERGIDTCFSGITHPYVW